MSLPDSQSSPSKRRTPLWIVAAWVLVLAVVAWRNVPVAEASHSHNGWDQLHISTMHTVGSTEQYCVMSQTSAIDVWQMRDFIHETLVLLDFSIIWDGTGDWKVDFRRTSKLCDQYDTATRDTIEIEYRLKDSWTAECGGSIYSCVQHVNPLTDSTGGHQHYRWMNSLLKTSHVSGYDERARKFINHETGHILGLKDPEYWGDCMHSVMHNNLYYEAYGCTDPTAYPTPSDFTSVKSVMARTN